MSRLITGVKTNLQAMYDAAHGRTSNANPSKPLDLAAVFVELWKHWAKAPEPLREWKFFPGRKWRFDIAWPSHRVAVELDGGIWSRGRHVRGAGFQRDLEKHNAATLSGWRVLRYTADDLKERPVQVVEEVESLLLRELVKIRKDQRKLNTGGSVDVRRDAS